MLKKIEQVRGNVSKSVKELIALLLNKQTVSSTLTNEYISGLVYFLQTEDVALLRQEIVTNMVHDQLVVARTKKQIGIIQEQLRLPDKNNMRLKTQWQRTVGGINPEDFKTASALWNLRDGKESREGTTYGQFFPSGHLILFPDEPPPEGLLKPEFIDSVTHKGYEDPKETILNYWMDKIVTEELLHATGSAKLWTAECDGWAEPPVVYYTAEILGTMYGFDMLLTSEREEIAQWKNVVDRYGDDQAQSLFLDDNLDPRLLNEVSTLRR